jgi:hypothetical protein
MFSDVLRIFLFINIAIIGTQGSPTNLNTSKENLKHIKQHKNILHQPKRKMRQTYLFLYILKLCFK